MAPSMIDINAIVPFMFILKCILKARANIKNPDAAIICMLAFISNTAKIKQAIVEQRIPKKK